MSWNDLEWLLYVKLGFQANTSDSEGYTFNGNCGRSVDE